MDQKNLISSISSDVSYANAAFCFEDEGRTIKKLLGAISNETDFPDSTPNPAKSGETKPAASSSPNQVRKKPQTTGQHIAERSNRSKTKRQRFGRADVARQVARMNESSEFRECLSFLCVLLLGAAGVGVFLMLVQFSTKSTVAAAIAVIGASVILVFIFICITTLLRDGTSLHRD
ncbi:unnamed protein product [Larinioides sclopetarius]|uniref:Uncharacterized protein n=1 Tax=Larinioides sclopetarius TaxID=280406 RepID=A0AAV2C2I2_9ARAC